MIEPDDVFFMPERVRSRVVLPAPFDPIIAANFPVGTASET
jgi:hypothetical protein